MAESVPDEYLSGYPVQAVGGTRTVEIQNNSSKLWVYALTSSSVGADDPTPPPAKADIVSGTDSEKPDHNQQVYPHSLLCILLQMLMIILQWKLLLLDSGLQHYRVQNIGTHKYASVGESPQAGANVQQSSDHRVWKIESKDNKSYT